MLQPRELAVDLGELTLRLHCQTLDAAALPLELLDPALRGRDALNDDTDIGILHGALPR